MPRAGLSRTVVVVAAADLADATGCDGLTLAAVARRLGVAVPSLYKHIDGLDDLRRGISILALAALADALRSAADHTARLDGSARLRALADAYRRFALGHPGRYAATVRAAPPGDRDHAAAADRVLRAVLGPLEERGLVGDEAIDATRALRAGLHGCVALESSGGFGMPRDVDRSFERLVAILDQGLRVGRDSR